MDHEEWIHFVWFNRSALTEQLRSLLPGDIEFTNIDPGLHPIIYLKRPHGSFELCFLALEVELDERDDIRHIDILWPR